MKKVNIKKAAALFFILVLSVVTACGKPAYISDYTDNNIRQDSFTDSKDRFTFLHEGNERMCTNYSGLYYIKVSTGENSSEPERVMYYDYAAGTSSVWCSNVSCTHDSEMCPAFVSPDYSYVEWSEGYIYKIREDDTGIYLVRFNEDSSGETDIVNLIKDINGSVSVNFGRVYNNKFYYCVSGEDNKYNYYRADLGKKDSKEYLFSLDSVSNKIAMTGFFINDSCIYVSSAQYGSGKKDYKRVVYSYSFKDKEVKELISRDDYYRTTANDKLYIFTEKKELFKVTENGETQEVSAGKFKSIKDGKYGIYCNEKYIIIMEDLDTNNIFDSGERMIYVYDIEKDILNGISVNELRGNDNIDQTETASESYETVQAGDGAAYINASFDFFSIHGITGNYCIMDSDKEKNFYLLDLTSVSDEELKCKVIDY